MLSTLYINFRGVGQQNDQMIEEEGHCIPVRSGGFIEGSKNY